MVWPIIDEEAVAPYIRRTAGASQRAEQGSGGRIRLVDFSLFINLTLGYTASVTDLNKAASLLGCKSALARRKKWGKKEFVRKMREWGKLGGRPKGSGKAKQKAR
jgi:hypothetical protein